MLIGATALRHRLGLRDQRASGEALVPKLVELAESAMSSGAFGVSFGLAYAPGTSRGEVVALFSAAARHGGIAAVHPRYFSSGLPGWTQDAIAGQKELIDAARETGAKLQVSHLAHQIAFRSRPYDALLRRGLEQLETARDDGVDLMADCLPIHFNGAMVSEPFMDIVLSPAVQALYDVRPEDVLEAADGPFKGAQVSREMFVRLRKEAPNTKLKVKLMTEDLTVRAMLPSWVMVSNDSADGEGNPAEPKVLGRYVRDLHALTLMEALDKMTAMPAARLGLAGKGRIAVGADADLTLFNPDTVAGLDYWPEPNVIHGIEHVIVNGVPVLRGGQLLPGTRPGRSVRHKDWQ
jgi:N-acyl-D-aspartate/D-glutamate deacylase